MAAPWVVALPAGRRPVGQMGRDTEHSAGLVHHELLLGCVGAEACAWVPELGTGDMHRGAQVCHAWQADVAGDSQNLCLCVLFIWQPLGSGCPQLLAFKACISNTMSPKLSPCVIFLLGLCLVLMPGTCMGLPGWMGMCA